MNRKGNRMSLFPEYSPTTLMILALKLAREHSQCEIFSYRSYNSSFLSHLAANRQTFIASFADINSRSVRARRYRAFGNVRLLILVSTELMAI